MLNIYLFIELLGAANADRVMQSIRDEVAAPCQLENVVKLSGEKLVAQVNTEKKAGAIARCIDGFMKIDGIVQTNIIAVVSPVSR